MKQPSTLQSHLAIAFTTIIFGMHYSIAKNIMPAHILPMQLIFLRVLGGVILFWLFQAFFIKEKVDRKDIWRLVICGLLGFSLNQALFYVGLNLTAPTDAAIIHVLNPIFVLLFASLLLREKVTWMKVIGIALGASGALILILYGKVLKMNSGTTEGNILVFLNMLSYALYLVMIKPLTAKYHMATILKWVSLFGFLFVVPFSAGPMMKMDFGLLDLQSWLSIAYIIVLNTFVAYLLINFALQTLAPTSISLYNYLQPVIASIMSVSMGLEILTLHKLVAALLIFAGVYVVGRGDRKRVIL